MRDIGSRISPARLVLGHRAGLPRGHRPGLPRGRRPGLPRRTLRLRLTVLYGGLFLVAGAILLVITYELVANDTGTRNSLVVSQKAVGAGAVAPPDLRPVQSLLQTKGLPGGPNVLQVRAVNGRVTAAFRRLTAAQTSQIDALRKQASRKLKTQHDAQLNALLTKSGIALGIMALASIGLGWIMAGRALRPLRTMSARARGISERNLHQRLALTGPDDELKELGDTFDGLLARLEAAFESQRRFVANASHELRTPVTLERALVEIALADPEPTVESLRETCARVLATSEQQERLIGALLALARSQRGIEEPAALDLGAIAGEVVGEVQPNGIQLNSALAPAAATGDPALVRSLVANLIENALRHNTEHGWVRTWTGIAGGRPTLRVTNTGPIVTPENAAALTEPFRRGQGVRTQGDGLGLGLSIVDAIAAAHGAELNLRPRPGGGLEVEVSFPPPADPTLRLV